MSQFLYLTSTGALLDFSAISSNPPILRRCWKFSNDFDDALSFLEDCFNIGKEDSWPCITIANTACLPDGDGFGRFRLKIYLVHHR
mmetsp:Transcript_17663/g.29367  ORF Transcript_17663/g.29367 Transcript_17663/m.29367 type:complete len:86 (+) Transcript_17663:90-347(+)